MERLTKDPNFRPTEAIEADLARIREEETKRALQEVPVELLWAELERRYSPDRADEEGVV